MEKEKAHTMLLKGNNVLLCDCDDRAQVSSFIMITVWQTKRFLPFSFSVFLLSLRLQDDKDYRHSGRKHRDYTTSILLSSCVVFFPLFTPKQQSSGS